MTLLAAMLTVLGNVDGGGASITKGTLEVVLIILAIVVLLVILFGRGRGWFRR